MSIVFDDPWYFLALLLLPLIGWRLLSPALRARVGVPNGRVLGRLPTSARAATWWLPPSLRLLALAVLIFAIARPQTEEKELVSGEGVDIMLAMDMSRSMNVVDMPEAKLDAILAKGELPPNRFEAAREILQDFIASRGQDRIGLVIFGPEAFLKYPLTLDYPRLIQTLDDLVLDFGPLDRRTGKCLNGCTIAGTGTAIGDALGRAYRRLARSSAKTRIIVLITDGKQEQGAHDPLAVAREIAKRPIDEQVRIYTFQVGSQDQTWLPQTDLRGRVLRDARGLPSYARPDRPFPVDPELLAEIAELTGGKFYESPSPEAFAEDIRDFERTVFESELKVHRADVFMPLVIVALLLLLLEWLLRFTAYRSVV